MPMEPPDDPEDADPGLARERTRLAWARTSIAFAAVGAAVLRRELVPGLIVLTTAPLIWVVGSIATRARPGPRPGRLLVVTVIVTVVAVLGVVAALIGHGPASLHQLLHV
jgi:uncharacterized membrane protein YidH (DUF202 family)